MGEGVAGRAGGGWEGGGTVHFRNCDDRPRRTTDGRSTIIIIEKVSRPRARARDSFVPAAVHANMFPFPLAASP